MQINDFKAVIQAYQDLISQGIDPVLLTHQIIHHLRDDLESAPDDQRGRIIDLLEDLMAVFNAKQPQASLEITLLKHTQPQSTLEA